MTSKHPMLLAGQIVIKGDAQEMQDGTWAARCCVTEHFGRCADDHLLDGGGLYFKTREEAVTKGIHLGVAWTHNKYPTNP